MSAGRVDAVWGERLGAGVTVAATEGDQVITVDYAGDFDEDGGRLLHRESGETYSYDTADPDGDTVTLSAPLPAGVSWDEGDAIYVHPLASDWYAAVRLDDVDEEPIVARLPFSMRSTLPEGIREFARGEPVTLDDLGDEWVITDVSGTELDRVEIRDAEGVTRQILGLQDDERFTKVDFNGVPGPAPTAPILEPDTLGVAVTWDGGFVAAEPSDHSHVRVRLGDTSGVPGPIVATLNQPGQVTVSPLVVETKYVVLEAVTTSGAVSDPSTEVSATPNEVVATDLLNGIVDELALADDAVTKAKVAADAIGETEIGDDSIATPHLQTRIVQAVHVAVETLLAENIATDAITTRTIRALNVTADELAANSVIAEKVAAGEINADHLAAILVLASRVVAGDPTAARVEINGSGIEAFDGDGNRTVAIRSDGSAFFSGDLGADTVGGEQLQAGSVTADSLSLGSGDTELLTDPSFESGIEGTQLSETWERSTLGVARSGDTSLFTQINAGVTAEYAFLDSVGVTGSSSFDTSAWTKTANRTFTVEIRHVYYDSGGAVVQDTSISQDIADDGNWHKMNFNTAVPDTGATFRPSVRTTNNGSDVGNTYVDDASVVGNATNVEFTSSGMEISSTANLADGDPAPLTIRDDTFRTMAFDSNQIEVKDTGGGGQTLFLNPAPAGTVVLGTTSPSMPRINGLHHGYDVYSPDSSGNVDIPHELDMTPTVVTATVRAADTFTTVRWAPLGSNATTFRLVVTNYSGNPVTGDTGLSWIAIA